MRMNTKKDPKNPRRKRDKDEATSRGGPWPDPDARKEMSQGEADHDAGKHAKNPDWQKRW
jgi:hypothetical protein